MSFLPDNYEKPASGSNYMKLEQGENRFRILSDAVTGWIDWDKSGEKPVPVRTKEKEQQLGENKIKHFWSFVVYDYGEKAIKILEITQATIQDAIYSLHGDSNWGDPKNYDINIVKTGEKMETRYNVMPAPPKPLTEAIKGLYGDVKIDLNKLFSNEDPFDDTKTPKEQMQEGIDKQKEIDEAFPPVTEEEATKSTEKPY